LLTDDNKYVGSFTKFSQFYLNSATPAALTVDIPLKNAAASTVYARVVAYDSYKNPSAPIVSEKVKR